LPCRRRCRTSRWPEGSERRRGGQWALARCGLGPIIGPVGSFAALPDAAKWLLAFGMLLGRLELFTVLVLLTPKFWRG
jgi:hypothetical protein